MYFRLFNAIRLEAIANRLEAIASRNKEKEKEERSNSFTTFAIPYDSKLGSFNSQPERLDVMLEQEAHANPCSEETAQNRIHLCLHVAVILAEHGPLLNVWKPPT